MRKNPRRIWRLTIPCALLIAGICGCDRGPTKPHQPIEYSAFFAGGNAYFYRYDLERKALDSGLITVNPGSPFTPSADGTKLYCPGYLEEGVNVLDTRTWQVIDQLPVIGTVVTSPDGRLLAIHGEHFYILNARTKAILFEDTIAVGRGVFNRDASGYFGVIPGDSCDTDMYSVDIRHGYAVSRECIGSGAVFRDPLLSPDETKLFLYKRYSTFVSALEEYDLVSHAVTFQEVLIPGAGHMAMHPDGYIGFTNVHDEPHVVGPPPPYGYATLDLAAKTIDTAMWLSAVCDTFSWGLHEIVYSPDKKWMLGLNQAGRVWIFNSISGQVVRSICVAENHGAGQIVINNGSQNGRFGE